MPIEFLDRVFEEPSGAMSPSYTPGVPLALSSAFVGPDGGPKEFGIVLEFDTPFRYDPALGSLLLEVQLFDGAGSLGAGSLDAHDDSADDIARHFSTTLGPGGKVNARAGFHATSGFVTRFGFSPIREPVSAFLLGLGLLGRSRQSRDVFVSKRGDWPCIRRLRTSLGKSKSRKTVRSYSARRSRRERPEGRLRDPLRVRGRLREIVDSFDDTS